MAFVAGKALAPVLYPSTILVHNSSIDPVMKNDNMGTGLDDHIVKSRVPFTHGTQIRGENPEFGDLVLNAQTTERYPNSGTMQDAMR